MIEIEAMGGNLEISSESFVNISKNEYEELVRDSERLAVLESMIRSENVPFYRETLLAVCGYVK